ncbi:MAG TPA: hypothetical protein VGM39_19075 [Kofleriaceae bacterium]
MRWVLASLLVFSACSGDDGGSTGGDDSGSNGHDAGSDSQPPDPCVAAGCTADQVCVQSYDGTCAGGFAHCVAKTVDCPLTGSCSDECRVAYCPAAPYQCQNREGCGGESPHAFTCYGP